MSSSVYNRMQAYWHTVVKPRRVHEKVGISKQGSAQDYWHVNQASAVVKATRQTHGATFCCSVSAETQVKDTGTHVSLYENKSPKA